MEMKLYRIEKDAENGVWYDRNGNFCLADESLAFLPMPSEPSVYKGIYKSSCASVEELLYWLPEHVQERLKAMGYKLVEYESDDYFSRDHGEVCFNKLTAKRRVLGQ